MQIRRRIVSGCLCLALLGCGSAPTIRYNTLMPDRSAQKTSTEADFTFDLQPVGLPAQIDRTELIVYDSQGRLLVLEDELWSAPLSDEIRDALGSMLAWRLGATNVSGLAVPAGKDVVRVKVEIRRFDSIPGKSALLEVDWGLGLTSSRGTRRLVCHSVLEEPAASAAVLVSGHRRNLEMLALMMARTVKDFVTSSDAKCATGSLRNSGT